MSKLEHWRSPCYTSQPVGNIWAVWRDMHSIYIRSNTITWASMIVLMTSTKCEMCKRNNLGVWIRLSSAIRYVESFRFDSRQKWPICNVASQNIPLSLSSGVSVIWLHYPLFWAVMEICKSRNHRWSGGGKDYGPVVFFPCHLIYPSSLSGNCLACILDSNSIQDYLHVFCLAWPKPRGKCFKYR